MLVPLTKQYYEKIAHVEVSVRKKVVQLLPITHASTRTIIDSTPVKQPMRITRIFTYLRQIHPRLLWKNISTLNSYDRFWKFNQKDYDYAEKLFIDIIKLNLFSSPFWTIYIFFILITTSSHSIDKKLPIKSQWNKLYSILKISYLYVYKIRQKTKSNLNF